MNRELRSAVFPIIAQRLYEAHCNASNWKNFRGDQYPPWNTLPDSIKKNWLAVAVKAYALYTEEQ